MNGKRERFDTSFKNDCANTTHRIHDNITRLNVRNSTHTISNRWFKKTMTFIQRSELRNNVKTKLSMRVAPLFETVWIWESDTTCVRMISSTEKLFYKGDPGSYFFILKMNINLNLLIGLFLKMPFQFLELHKKKQKTTRQEKRMNLNIKICQRNCPFEMLYNGRTNNSGNIIWRTEENLRLFTTSLTCYTKGNLSLKYSIIKWNSYKFISKNKNSIM